VGVRGSGDGPAGDVSGTVEAVTSALAQLRNRHIYVRILHAAVGEITEADIALAAASKGAGRPLAVPAQAQRGREGTGYAHATMRGCAAEVGVHAGRCCCVGVGPYDRA
jgi:hypothetical protein